MNKKLIKNTFFAIIIAILGNSCQNKLLSDNVLLDSKHQKETEQYIKDILDLEKNIPGIFPEIIRNSLAKHTQGNSPNTIGICIAAHGMNSIFNPTNCKYPINLSNKMSSPYDRELYCHELNLGVFSDIFFYIINQEMPFHIRYTDLLFSKLSSDQSKIEDFKSHTTNDENNMYREIDMYSSIYDKSLKRGEVDKKTQIVETCKPFCELIHDKANFKGYRAVRDKDKYHLLEKLIIKDIAGILDLDIHNRIVRDNYYKETFSWIEKILDMIACIDICNVQWSDGSLKENQELYGMFCKLFELYHHLIFALIVHQTEIGNPIFSYTDYKNAMHRIAENRLLHIIKSPEIASEHIATKSGMDSITKILCAISKIEHYCPDENLSSPYPISISADVNKDDEIVYYEIERIIGPFEKKFKIPTIITGITCAQYSPNGIYNTKKIIESALNLGPQILIFDSTVQLYECEKDPIYKVLSDTRIQKKILGGQLVVFLAKSFQKFATFGTQKMRAGDINIIGNKNSFLYIELLQKLQPKFDDIFTANAWQAEMQWLTHILTYNDFELDFLKQCDSNINFILEKKLTLNNDLCELYGKSFSMLFFKSKLNMMQKAMYLKDCINGNKNYLDTGIVNCPTTLQSFPYLQCSSGEYGVVLDNNEKFTRYRLNIGLEPEKFIEQLFTSKDPGYYETTSLEYSSLEDGLLAGSHYIVDFEKFNFFKKISFLDSGSSENELYKSAKKCLEQIVNYTKEEEKKVCKDFTTIIQYVGSKEREEYIVKIVKQEINSLKNKYSYYLENDFFQSIEECQSKSDLFKKTVLQVKILDNAQKGLYPVINSMKIIDSFIGCIDMYNNSKQFDLTFNNLKTKLEQDNNILAIQIVDKIVTKLRDNKKMIIAELNKTKNGFTKKLQDFMNETYSNAKKDEFYIKHVYDFL